MIIGHNKNTPIAYAPEAISEVINKYTEHNSYVFGYGYPNSKIIPKTDIIHQHNKDVIDFHRKLIQYHSEPFRVDLNTKIKKLVIAQYHATLVEYTDASIVRNPIDLYNMKYIPKYIDDKVKIGYSPSTLIPQSEWADKGYSETIEVLNKLKKKYGNKIDVDIITNVGLNECLNRKSMCNIFIDEVKTGSYHRSGLESLGMGIPTICRISPEVEKIIKFISKSEENPFINQNINNLYEKLDEMINMDILEILKIGYECRRWMEVYWDPKTIANEYIIEYNKI